MIVEHNELGDGGVGAHGLQRGIGVTHQMLGRRHDFAEIMRGHVLMTVREPDQRAKSTSREATPVYVAGVSAFRRAAVASSKDCSSMNLSTASWEIQRRRPFKNEKGQCSSKL